jgi:deazaflavin-dependent oxidoreductase (nitroreductase family)
MNLMQETNRRMGELMARSGRVVMIETRGRVTGQLRRTPVGYHQRPDGTFVVGAGSTEAHWARNLRANPRAAILLRGERRTVVAEEIEGRERDVAVHTIHERYGARAGRVGIGPVFLLRPAE